MILAEQTFVGENGSKIHADPLSVGYGQEGKKRDRNGKSCRKSRSIEIKATMIQRKAF